MKLNYFWLVCVNKLSLFLVPGYHNGNDFSTVRKANPFWLVQSWNPHNKYKQTNKSFACSICCMLFYGWFTPPALSPIDRDIYFSFYFIFSFFLRHLFLRSFSFWNSSGFPTSYNSFSPPKKQRQKYLIKSHFVARQVICICSYRYSRYTCSCMSFITCSSWFLIWLQNPLAYGFYAGLGDIRQMFMRPHNGNGDGKGKFN